VLAIAVFVGMFELVKRCLFGVEQGPVPGQKALGDHLFQRHRHHPCHSVCRERYQRHEAGRLPFLFLRPPGYRLCMLHDLARSVRVPLIAVLLALVLLPAGPAGAKDPTKGPRVEMREFKFIPGTLTIRAGQSVTWTYDESITNPMPNCETLQTGIPGAGCPGHSTTSFDKRADGKPLWDSGVHRADGFPFKFTFTKPGTYKYYCIPHGGPNETPLTQMDGVITVK
jgi:plastocyanin